MFPGPITPIILELSWKVKLCSHYTPHTPADEWLGKGPLLKNEAEADAIHNDTPDVNRLL